MRVLLGLVLLGGLFLTALGWQLNHTRSALAHREDRYGPGPLEADGEWSLLVLGAISGAAPIERAPDHPSRVSKRRGGRRGAGHGAGRRFQGAAPADPPPPAPRYAPDYRYVVRAGDVLGRICRRHYGSANPALVEALARYNGLATPDAIRVGEALLLPDRARLED